MLSGSLTVIGSQNTGKPTWMAQMLLLKTYLFNPFTRPGKHTTLLSHHANHRKAIKDRQYLPTACLDQCCNGLWSFHWAVD